MEGTLEDGLLSLDEENALAEYADYFSLCQHDLDRNGVQTNLVQAAVIRDVTQGIIPQRHRVNGAVLFNLMKSEQLIWVIQDVDYLETVTRRERRGTSHGVSIRVARGLYYRPSTVPEPVHTPVGGDGPRRYRPAGADDQAPVLRRKARKKFRVRYDKIVSLRALRATGLGIMRDAQTAKPQTFRTGDGWSAYNLAANLAHIQG